MTHQNFECKSHRLELGNQRLFDVVHRVPYLHQSPMVELGVKSLLIFLFECATLMVSFDSRDQRKRWRGLTTLKFFLQSLGDMLACWSRVIAGKVLTLAITLNC